uniref:Uncharacterized protein n=1 Tax=Nelumbo nucifera TaxID=4432 RepID=A0A822Z886_NELNU|nr:TPA_asm: hypothetical protein HUJ06_008349 [Nelumbo nucifera]
MESRMTFGMMKKCGGHSNMGAIRDGWHKKEGNG